jgi:hypothetical protein
MDFLDTAAISDAIGPQVVINASEGVLCSLWTFSPVIRPIVGTCRAMTVRVTRSPCSSL